MRRCSIDALVPRRRSECAQFPRAAGSFHKDSLTDMRLAQTLAKLFLFEEPGPPNKNEPLPVLRRGNLGGEFAVGSRGASAERAISSSPADLTESISRCQCVSVLMNDNINN